MAPSFAHAWHWIVGAGAAGFVGFEELARAALQFKVRRDKKKTLAMLERGGPGVGLMGFQLAEQCGWSDKKARRILRALKRAGKVREAEGRWYATQAAGPQSGMRNRFR